MANTDHPPYSIGPGYRPPRNVGDVFAEPNTLRYAEQGTVQPPVPKSPYYGVLEELKALHLERARSYGQYTDPDTNLRNGEGFGIPNWISVMVRGEDKMRRIRKAAMRALSPHTHNVSVGDPESLEDAFLDLANYAIFGLLLYREARSKQENR